MEVIIDLKLIKNPDDFYNQLTYQVDFGPFFGRNLDAFWDYIDLLEGEKVLFVNYSLLNESLNAFFVEIISIINKYNLNLIRIGLTAKKLIKLDIHDFIPENNRDCPR